MHWLATTADSSNRLIGDALLTSDVFPLHAAFLCFSVFAPGIAGTEERIHTFFGVNRLWGEDPQLQGFY